MRTLTSTQLILSTGISLTLFFSYFLIANAHEVTSTETEATTTEEMSLGHFHSEATSTENTTSTEASSPEKRQELKEEKKSALREIIQQRIINLSANISNRMEAVIERFYNIIERLETRIEKLKQTDVNTASAAAKLREAAQLIAEAKTKLNNIDNLVYSATTSTQPESDWKVVRETYQEAGRLIRASHQALRETVALLKTSVSEADLQKSTTATGNNGTSSLKTE